MKDGDTTKTLIFVFRHLFHLPNSLQTSISTHLVSLILEGSLDLPFLIYFQGAISPFIQEDRLVSICLCSQGDRCSFDWIGQKKHEVHLHRIGGRASISGQLTIYVKSIGMYLDCYCFILALLTFYSLTLARAYVLLTCLRF